WYAKNRIRLHAGVRVEQIDRARRVVVGKPTRGGHGGTVVLEEPYDKLILATGSRPFVPPLEGVDKRGVFVFRTFEDCTLIAERAGRAQRAVVLGGGLLGLEAARGLLSHGLEVTVVEMAPHLMVQQLDADAAAILRKQMEKLGVGVLVGKQTRRL